MILVYSRSHTISSALIRLLTGSRWSHCAVVLSHGRVVEATAARGVIITDWKDFVLKSSKYELASVDLPGEEAAVAWLLQQLGKPYDWTAIFSFFFRRNWQEDDSWFCSELIEATCAAGGRRRFRHFLSRITPGQSYLVV